MRAGRLSPGTEDVAILPCPRCLVPDQVARQFHDNMHALHKVGSRERELAEWMAANYSEAPVVFLFISLSGAALEAAILNLIYSPFACGSAMVRKNRSTSYPQTGGPFGPAWMPESHHFVRVSLAGFLFFARVGPAGPDDITLPQSAPPPCLGVAARSVTAFARKPGPPPTKSDAWSKEAAHEVETKGWDPRRPPVSLAAAPSDSAAFACRRLRCRTSWRFRPPKPC
jgi:hypothetical protein